jgi:uncharacterized protein YebE (UPF0316 family)
MTREVAILELGYRVVNVETAQRSLGVSRWMRWNAYRVTRWGY